MIWTINSGIKWSWHRDKLFTTPAKTHGHEQLHQTNGLPVGGPAFDNVVRGRAALFKGDAKRPTKLVIETVSLGSYEHLPNKAYEAILNHFEVDDETTEIEMLLPGWAFQ